MFVFIEKMSYTSLTFYVFLLLIVFIYYIVAKTNRWIVLLVGSGLFYYAATQEIVTCLFFIVTIIISYVWSVFIASKFLSEKSIILRKLILGVAIITSAFPLILSRLRDLVFGSIMHLQQTSWLLPLGLAFYSLQMIAYLVDVYNGEVVPQRNIFKYALFISFFPHIIQGPIPRYESLNGRLFDGCDFDKNRIMNGIQLIIWGFFLKFMIADKAAVIVDPVFDNTDAYKGMYIWVAAALYSVQLYADFYGCVTICQGVAGLFGIDLEDNFERPYFSGSIKEFWRRWHISLSKWLRDYIYYPLGGSNKGRFIKYLSVMITFLVSGIWHGGHLNYIFWGIMHGLYRIINDITIDIRRIIKGLFHMNSESSFMRKIDIALTFFIVMIAWIVFRAVSLKTGITMIINMFRICNPWILFDGSLVQLGLNFKEWIVLLLSILILFSVSVLQEKGIKIREVFDRQSLPIRWVIYLLAICTIWVMGTYGYGFDADGFIYGRF